MSELSKIYLRSSLLYFVI